MRASNSHPSSRVLLLGLAISAGLFLAIALIASAGRYALKARAAPIEPPAGYPKFDLSNMTVSPDLAASGGARLLYRIEIANTGAYTGYNVSLTDNLPANTVYNNDAGANVSPSPVVTNGVLTWQGTVGFDTSVVVTFSVNVFPAYLGVVTNKAAISHASLVAPLLVSAEAMITDDPLFEIEKTSSPAVPGPNKPLTYTLSITNRGQPATSLPVTVTDKLPLNTSFLSAESGTYNSTNKTVTWLRSVTLGTGETSQFTYSVQVGNVPSGTVISNDNYQVSNPLSGVAAGEVYTVTVLKPVLFLYKETDPFPPGSNREMTYTLTVLNTGSQATNLVISDQLPAGVTYVRGGTKVGNTISWNLPKLDTGESAQVSFTVYIGDVAEVPILNTNYQVCSAEQVCQTGIPLTSIVKGPSFEAGAFLYPIAKKPGGGGGPVTPTLTIKNLGPGNALAATASLYFRRISVSLNDLRVIPQIGTLKSGSVCGDKCVSYRWSGDLGYGQTVTFTVDEGQSTIGGEEGTIYTATIVVSDTLSGFAYEPITATATGKVTHFANLIPNKTAPTVIGAGQIMTYTINVFNSGLTTDVPPYPTLTDTVPASTTLVSVADGGKSFTLGGETVVSWTLPSMSPGDMLNRRYAVQVDDGLVSGTLIVNDDYGTSWFDVALITQTYTLSHTGEPFTTVVREVGLVDSFKTVTPTMALPAEDNLLTYTVHVVNSSPVRLSGVKVHDLLPWQSSTYQRDALASSGQVISDIVSIDWSGDVEPLSEQLITFTVLVDPYFEGPLTNTAVITHSSLSGNVVVKAVAYITDDPVLRITKTASPDPVAHSGELLYTLHVTNLGQQATELVVTDTVPAETSFMPFSASGNGQLVGDQVRWEFPVLPAEDTQELTFRVKVNGYDQVTNAAYRVSCAEGVSDIGVPLVTKITGGWKLFLPILHRR